MVENEYGKLLEKLMHFSSQKNYSLAITLGYDVSYISKWMNLSTLPTSKNIENINKKISEFIVKSSSELALNNLMDYFDIEKDDNIDNQILIQKIEEHLNKAYAYSYNKFNKKSLKKSNEKNNSIQTSNYSHIKKYLDNEISTFIKESIASEIIVLCNFFSLNKDDKVRVAGADFAQNKKYAISKSEVSIRYLLSFDGELDDLAFDIPLFIYMVTSKQRIKSIFYSCNFPSKTFISVVKNKCSHTAIYDNNNKCLMCITSTDEKAVDDVYETLNNMTYSQCREIFMNITPEQMLLNENNISYSTKDKIQIVLGEITELLMPSDLFLEVANGVFECNEKILSELNKIDSMIQAFTYNSNMEIILYESALRKYVQTGEITFYNKSITLTMEQRKKHLKYIKNILEDKENINVNLIEESAIYNYKEDEKIYLSIHKENTYLKQSDNGESRDYLVVKDIKLENILKKFFDEMWNEYNKEKDKDRLKSLIDDSIRYIEVFTKI